MKINTIYNVDCIAGMGMIADGSVDMILSDLPYGMTHCRWDSVLPLPLLWEQYKRVIKDNGAIALTCIQPFTTTLIQSNRQWFRYCWYWLKNCKTGVGYSHKQPMRCIEDVAVFYQHQPTYNPQGLIRLDTPITQHCKRKGGNVYSDTLDGDYEQVYTGYPSHLLEIPHDTHRVHPTQKPVALMEYLIRTYTNPGDLVLDTCMGSGTTAVACIRAGRQYIGFEIDVDMCERASARIMATEGEMALLDEKQCANRG